MGTKKFNFIKLNRKANKLELIWKEVNISRKYSNTGILLLLLYFSSPENQRY
jgi:hypothetical protein